MTSHETGIRIRHLAFTVTDLEEAEEYYGGLFAAELVGREARLDDGLWYTLPPGTGWPDARAAGLDLHMVALRIDRAVLVLFVGADLRIPPIVGMEMDRSRLAEVRERIHGRADVLVDGDQGVVLRDRFGVEWQLSLPNAGFKTQGELAGRWLSV